MSRTDACKNLFLIYFSHIKIGIHSDNYLKLSNNTHASGEKKLSGKCCSVQKIFAKNWICTISLNDNNFKSVNFKKSPVKSLFYTQKNANGHFYVS